MKTTDKRKVVEINVTWGPSRVYLRLAIKMLFSRVRRQLIREEFVQIDMT